MVETLQQCDICRAELETKGYKTIGGKNVCAKCFKAGYRTFAVPVAIVPLSDKEDLTERRADQAAFYKKLDHLTLKACALLNTTVQAYFRADAPSFKADKQGAMRVLGYDQEIRKRTQRSLSELFARMFPEFSGAERDSLKLKGWQAYCKKGVRQSIFNPLCQKYGNGLPVFKPPQPVPLRAKCIGPVEKTEFGYRTTIQLGGDWFHVGLKLGRKDWRVAEAVRRVSGGELPVRDSRVGRGRRDGAVLHLVCVDEFKPRSVKDATEELMLLITPRMLFIARVNGRAQNEVVGWTGDEARQCVAAARAVNQRLSDDTKIRRGRRRGGSLPFAQMRQRKTRLYEDRIKSIIGRIARSVVERAANLKCCSICIDNRDLSGYPANFPFMKIIDAIRLHAEQRSILVETTAERQATRKQQKEAVEMQRAAQRLVVFAQMQAESIEKTEKKASDSDSTE